MVRFIAGLVGLFFTGILLFSFLFGATAYVSDPPAATAEHEFHKHPREIAWSFDGPFGHYDKQQLQRGLQVYTEVCSACHSLRLVAFRDLKALGYNDAEIKAIAKARQVNDVDPTTGEPSTRPGVPADHFPLVYPNDEAARAANNNAIPPESFAYGEGPGMTGATIFIRCLLALRTSLQSCSRSFLTPRPRRDCTTTLISRTSISRCRRR